MKCSQDRSVQLMEYAEGTLPQENMADLEGHLSGCSFCREELEGWLRLEARLWAFPLAAEPAGFKAAVMGRVAESRRAQPVAYRPVEPAAALAFGAVLLAVGALLSGLADAGSWEWQFNAAYLVLLAHGVLQAGLDAVSAAGGLVLTSFLAAAYSNLVEAAPVLLTALLLAVFAIGPSEIAATLRPGEAGNRG